MQLHWVRFAERDGSARFGSMKPGSTVEVEIPGVGRLVNRFEHQPVLVEEPA